MTLINKNQKVFVAGQRNGRSSYLQSLKNNGYHKLLNMKREIN